MFKPLLWKRKSIYNRCFLIERCRPHALKTCTKQLKVLCKQKHISLWEAYISITIKHFYWILQLQIRTGFPERGGGFCQPKYWVELEFSEVGGKTKKPFERGKILRIFVIETFARKIQFYVQAKSFKRKITLFKSIIIASKPVTLVLSVWWNMSELMYLAFNSSNIAIWNFLYCTAPTSKSNFLVELMLKSVGLWIQRGELWPLT